MNTNEVMQMLKRSAVSIFSEETLFEKLNSGRPLKIKFGADPSRPDLHLGHSVPLRRLKMLQDLGHEIIFVIGDYTGMIGDPSGKSKTRVPLTFAQTRENGLSYFEQVTKILNKDKTTITYNSQWLSQMNFADVLRLAGTYTLARIMERDDFANRYAKNQPIGLHELLYPLMQGYDSVAIHADIEVGGTDQTFNLLVGRELQKDYGQERQEVITFPLLIGLDGTEKMSKSLDNTIGINEEPNCMFEKCMKVPDTLLSDYFRLTTDIPEAIYESVLATDIRQAHFAYAREIVTMYHGAELTLSAETRYREVAAGKPPDAVETIRLTRLSISLTDAVVAIGFASSNSDARRLITGGGIKLNGTIITDPLFQLHSPSRQVVSRGKNKFMHVEITAPK